MIWPFKKEEEVKYDIFVETLVERLRKLNILEEDEYISLHYNYGYPEETTRIQRRRNKQDEKEDQK